MIIYKTSTVNKAPVRNIKEFRNKLDFINKYVDFKAHVVFSLFSKRMQVLKFTIFIISSHSISYVDMSLKYFK